MTLPYCRGSNWGEMVFHTSSATNLSNALPGLDVRDTGLMSCSETGMGILGTGTAKAFFHRLGKTPSCKEELKMSQKGIANSGPNSFRSRGGISPGPGAFVTGILLSCRYTWCSLTVIGVGLAGRKAGRPSRLRGGSVVLMVVKWLLMVSALFSGLLVISFMLLRESFFLMLC